MFTSGANESDLVVDVLKASDKKIRKDDISGFEQLEIAPSDKITTLTQSTQNQTHKTLAPLTTGKGKKALARKEPDALDALLGVEALSTDVTRLGDVKTLGDVRKVSEDILERLRGVRESINNITDDPVRDIDRLGKAIANGLVEYGELNFHEDGIALYDDRVKDDGDIKGVILRDHLGRILSTGCWRLLVHIMTDIGWTTTRAYQNDVVDIITSNFKLPKPTPSLNDLVIEVRGTLGNLEPSWWMWGDDLRQSRFLNLSRDMRVVLLKDPSLVAAVAIGGSYYPEHYTETLLRHHPDIIIHGGE